MNRRIIYILLSILFAIVLSNCEKKTPSKPVTNIPPETSIFLSQPKDATGLVHIISWWGSDQDGYVVGYEYTWDDTSKWEWTTATKDTFSLIAPKDTIHIFYVRAKDNDGAFDPSPAVLRLPTKNVPPTIDFSPYVEGENVTKRTPRKESFTKVTFFWDYNDVDGFVSKIIVRLHFHTTSTDSIRIVLPDSTSKVPNQYTFEVKNIPGGISEDKVTVYINAVDNGNAISDTLLLDSGLPPSWIMKSPNAKVLLIDDNFETLPFDTIAGNFYINALKNSAYQNSFIAFDMYNNAPYTPEDLRSFLTPNHFPCIIWYSNSKTNIKVYEAILKDYISAGGRLYLDGTSIISADPLIKGFSLKDSSAFIFKYIDSVKNLDISSIDPGKTFTGSTSDNYTYPSLVCNMKIAKSDGFKINSNLADALYTYTNLNCSVGLKYPKTGKANLVFFAFPLYKMNRSNNAATVLVDIISKEFGIQ